MPRKNARPTTRKGRSAVSAVLPTPQLLMRKAEALGFEVDIDAKGRIKTRVDVHASTEPLDVLARPQGKDRKGVITEQQHQAGIAYRNLRIAVLGPIHPPAIGANYVSEHVGEEGLEDVREIDADDPEERAERRHAAWKGATRAIVERAGPAAYQAVIAVCIEGRMIQTRQYGDLREGLQVLVRRWRIA